MSDLSTIEIVVLRSIVWLQLQVIVVAFMRGDKSDACCDCCGDHIGLDNVCEWCYLGGSDEV